MSSTDIARVLVDTLALPYAIKTLSFSIMTAILVRENSSSRLGNLITAFFAVMSISSATITWMMHYIAMQSDDDIALSFSQWSMLVLLYILPILAGTLASSVAWIAIKEDREKTSRAV